MRRKIGMIILAAMLCGMSSVTAGSFGYGLSVTGQTVVDDTARSTGGMDLSFVYKPFSLRIMNPSLTLASGAGYDTAGTMRIPYVRLYFTFDMFRTLHHPFQFVTNNPSAYMPSFSIGYQWSAVTGRHVLFLAASPFKLAAKDFRYEFFCPFVTIDPSDGRTDSWGITLFRSTFLCE